MIGTPLSIHFISFFIPIFHHSNKKMNVKLKKQESNITSHVKLTTRP